MKVFITIDLEGITGVCTEEQTARGTAAYREAVELMHGDLEAAVAGCRDAGAKEIVVADAHDKGANLRLEAMPDGVILASGSPNRLSMMHGLDDSFAAVVMLGYHAMAGTTAAVLDHTYTYDVFRVRADEYLEIGEIGINAGVAGRFGVPVVFVAGDDRTAAEAEELLPGVRTAQTKLGSSRTAARLLPAAQTRAAIRQGVSEALSASDRPAPLDFSDMPLRVTFQRTRACDFAAQCPTAARLDARTIQLPGGDFLQTYRAFLTCLQLAYLSRE